MMNHQNEIKLGGIRFSDNPCIPMFGTSLSSQTYHSPRRFAPPGKFVDRSFEPTEHGHILRIHSGGWTCHCNKGIPMTFLPILCHLYAYVCLYCREKNMLIRYILVLSSPATSVEPNMQAVLPSELVYQTPTHTHTCVYIYI